MLAHGKHADYANNFAKLPLFPAIAGPARSSDVRLLVDVTVRCLLKDLPEVRATLMKQFRNADYSKKKGQKANCCGSKKEIYKWGNAFYFHKRFPRIAT